MRVKRIQVIYGRLIMALSSIEIKELMKKQAQTCQMMFNSLLDDWMEARKREDKQRRHGIDVTNYNVIPHIAENHNITTYDKGHGYTLACHICNKSFTFYDHASESDKIENFNNRLKADYLAYTRIKPKLKLQMY